MTRREPAGLAVPRLLVALLLALVLAACNAGQAEQREIAAEPAAPTTIDVPAEPAAPAQPSTDTAASTATAPAATTTPVLPAPGKGRSCRTDADCAVKDVGSCCGYHPQCLNKDTPTFPEEVKARCAREGRVSTCGMLAVSGCQCVSGQCENLLQSDESLPAAPAPLK